MGELPSEAALISDLRAFGAEKNKNISKRSKSRKYKQIDAMQWILEGFNLHHIMKNKCTCEICSHTVPLS